MFNFINYEVAAGLLKSGRVSTGVYAFVATLLGFVGFPLELPTMLLAAFTFMCLTMSIMTFNDIADRKRDALPDKARIFALEHEWHMLSYWLWGAIFIWMLIAILFRINPTLAAFCMIVWVIGLWYSYMPHLFLAQNVLVAFCSASPLLCGMVSNDLSLSEHWATFRLMLWIVLLNEFNKDVGDRHYDVDYKNTMPVYFDSHRQPYRVRRSAIFAAPLVVVIVVEAMHHPNQWLGYLVVCFGLVLVRHHVMLAIHPIFVTRSIKTIRRLIYTIGAVLAISAII